MEAEAAAAAMAAPILVMPSPAPTRFALPRDERALPRGDVAADRSNVDEVD